MVTCQYPNCDRKEALPFKCRYCTKLFCTIHRLPENHDCENLHLATSPSFSQPTVEEETQVEVSKKKTRRQQKKSPPMRNARIFHYAIFRILMVYRIYRIIFHGLSYYKISYDEIPCG